MIKGITYILKNDATLQSIIGQNAALTKHKVYPVIAPQSEVFPFSVVRMEDKQLTHKGTAGSNRNVFTVTVAVRSYHNSYDELDLLDRAIVQALVPFRGEANGVVFNYIEFTSSADSFVDYAGGVYERVSTFTANIRQDDLT